MANNVAKFQQHMPVGEAALFDSNMLALVKRTVAKDTTDDEFNVFIAMCRALRLDPLRKQAYAFVFKRPFKRGKNGELDRPEQRTLTLVTSITGFRTIADRTGNYRPDEDAPELHFDEAVKGATNPLGLVKAVCRVWKFSHGGWHKSTAEAYWDEFAPIKEEWAEGEDGKRRPNGKFVLDTSGQWGKMPRLMLSKCAEAAVLRKAFPDELSNVHEEAEIDRQKFIDLLPSEAVEMGEIQSRLERIGAASQTLMVDWLKGDMEPIEMVPLGQFADRAAAFIEGHTEDPSQVMLWAEKNRFALKEFWARSPSDALELKKMIEKATAPAA